MQGDAASGVGTARCPARNEPVVIEEQGEGFHAVLATAAGNVLITNDLGRHVLELCDGTRSTDEIVSDVAAKYPDVPVSTVTADVESFIETAVGKGALSWQP